MIYLYIFVFIIMILFVFYWRALVGPSKSGGLVKKEYLSESGERISIHQPKEHGTLVLYDVDKDEIFLSDVCSTDPFTYFIDRDSLVIYLGDL